MIWQQNGAPPHYGQIVRDYIDDTLYNGLIVEELLNGHHDPQDLFHVISHYGEQ